MRLKHIKIQDFRGITDFEWDFTNEFGEIEPLTIIVGPNSSGKTTILDAIWFGLKSIIGYPIQRIGFREEKRYVVRKGANYAKIGYELEISDTEHEQIRIWKEELVEREAIGDYKFPDEKIAKLTWTYPAQPEYKVEFYEYGGYLYKFDWALMQGSRYYRRLKDINAELPKGKEYYGGVYFVEQERRFDTEPVVDIESYANQDIDYQNKQQGLFKLRKELIRLGNRVNYFNDLRYTQIKDGFNYICAPAEMRDLVAVDEELDIEFRAANGMSYTFDGLSSGERSVLYFLTRYVLKQPRNAIVLIDELEMHLHPTWQRRLYESLQRFKDNNQFIITTHSPTVEEIAPDNAVILLGDLDVPEWQLEMDYSDDD
jgi:predicted ATPase